MKSHPPCFGKIGVIGLVPECWGGPWMPRHHVLTRLSEYFHVAWVPPAKYWRDYFRRTRAFRAWDADPERRQHAGFFYYRNRFWLPKMYGNRLLSDFTEKVRIRQVENELRHKGCERIIVYLWRPEFERALDFARHDMSCYHIDDEYTFSDKEEPIRDSEDRVIRRVDQVIIHSRALMEKKGKINPNTFFVPNGVDFKSYATPREEPGDLKPISRPRVGYVGIIKKQLDLPLLVTLARNHKDFSFVFVGPVGKVSGVEKSLSDLQGMPNVHFLGGKPVEALPAYVQHMDVCMLCYDLTGYTKFIYPMKLHEYLACGSPVIGTPIDSLREFSDVIHLARTPEEWSHALDKALSPEERSPERLARRVRVAKEHDWDGLVRSIAGKLYGRLGEQIDVRRAVHGSTKTDP